MTEEQMPTPKAAPRRTGLPNAGAASPMPTGSAAAMARRRPRSCSRRRCRRASCRSPTRSAADPPGASVAPGEEAARHDLRLDLGRALEDVEDARVAEDA